MQRRFSQRKKPPLYEEVKDLLDEDEVVTAKDYEIETGSVFDVKSDYTGLEIKDADKVKVTFEEAKNDKDEEFYDRSCGHLQSGLLCGTGKSGASEVSDQPKADCA